MSTTPYRPDEFLRMIRRAERGRLKIYLGYGAGVGKTYQMLLEGHRLKDEGIDVAVGLLETHGRAETAKLAEGLEVIPRRRVEYRGVLIEEMDLDAVLARKPQVALIDELAHTNVPGSRNPKRYQDVQEILDAGIHVITTLNVQHLESLYDTVEKAVHVKIRERLPDTVLAEADQIVNVDLSTEDLRKRLKEGKIYPDERIETALTHFFTEPNLENLRELTLRELASQIDLRRREATDTEAGAAPDQVMVCLSSRGPNSEMLLRYASRLAGRLNRNWYAVYVQTPSEEPTVIDAWTQRILAGTLTLAKQLGAMVFTCKGEDVVNTLLRFAREYRVGHIVVGRPSPRPLWKRWLRRDEVVERLIREARGATVTVLDTRTEEPPPAAPVEARAEAEPEPASLTGESAIPAAARQPVLSPLLVPGRIVIWNQAVRKEVAIRTLADAALGEGRKTDPATAVEQILSREEQGSTFFNEGAAFPHARIKGLDAPIAALGITRGGISDVSTAQPIEFVFLTLTPADDPEIQLKLLGLLARLARNRALVLSLKAARSPEDAAATIRRWEVGQIGALSEPRTPAAPG